MTKKLYILVLGAFFFISSAYASDDLKDENFNGKTAQVRWKLTSADVLKKNIKEASKSRHFLEITKLHQTLAGTVMTEAEIEKAVNDSCNDSLSYIIKHMKEAVILSHEKSIPEAKTKLIAAILKDAIEVKE